MIEILQDLFTGKAGSMDMNQLINNFFLIVWRHCNGKEKSDKEKGN